MSREHVLSAIAVENCKRAVPDSPFSSVGEMSHRHIGKTAIADYQYKMSAAMRRKNPLTAPEKGRMKGLDVAKVATTHQV